MLKFEGGQQYQVERPTRPGDYRFASKYTDVIKREIDDWLYKELNGIVQSGPFAGMKLLPEKSWKDGRMSPYLLGTYEEELYGALEVQIARLKKLPKPKISVIGCSEGYFAVGLKHRIPHADVYVVDCDDKAIEICGRAAAANDVSVIAGAPIPVVMENTDFMLMDVEGAEVEYLNVDSFPSLKQVTAIVEIHNFHATPKFAAQKTDDILIDRFRSTHRITMLFEGPRDPNKFPWLCHMTSDYRVLALSEGRTCLMGWFFMEPKGLSVV